MFAGDRDFATPSQHDFHSISSFPAEVKRVECFERPAVERHVRSLQDFGKND